MSVGLSHSQAHLLKRARIADAVLETVVECGYAEASVGRICGRAHVSTKTFYKCFTNRSEAFFHARARVLGQLGSVLDRACAVRVDVEVPTEALACAAALATWVQRHPGRARVCFVEAPIASAVAGTPDRHLDEVRLWCDRRRDLLPASSDLTDHEVVALGAGMLHGALSAAKVSAEALVAGLARMLGLQPTPAEIAGALEVAASQQHATAPRHADARLEQVVGRLGDRPGRGGAIACLREMVVQAAVESDEAVLHSVQDLLDDQCCDAFPTTCRAAVRGLVELAEAALAGGPGGVLELAGRGGRISRTLAPQALRTLGMIAERPGLNARELGRALGIGSDAQLSRILAGLRSDGLICDTGVGRRAWEATLQGTVVLQEEHGSTRTRRRASVTAALAASA